MIPNSRDADQKIFEFKKLLLALVEKILHVLLHKFQLLMIRVNSLLNHSAEFLNFRVRNFSIRISIYEIFNTSSYFCISSSPALISINWSNKIECFLFINNSPSAKAACISISASLIFYWSWSFLCNLLKNYLIDLFQVILRLPNSTKPIVNCVFRNDGRDEIF